MHRPLKLLSVLLVSACAAAPSSPGRTSELTLPKGFEPPAGCYFHGAVYRPHPGWETRSDEPFQYRLKVQRGRYAEAPHEATLVFEARERRSGTLLTTLRMTHTTSNNLARDAAYTEQGDVDAKVEHLDRNLGPAPEAEHPFAARPAAPFALLFTDLQGSLYYLQQRWDGLGASVTFHTPAQAKPNFTNMWVLAQCGAA